MNAEWTISPGMWTLALGVSCGLWAGIICAGIALVGAA